MHLLTNKSIIGTVAPAWLLTNALLFHPRPDKYLVQLQINGCDGDANRRLIGSGENKSLDFVAYLDLRVVASCFDQIQTEHLVASVVNRHGHPHDGTTSSRLCRWQL